MPNQRQEFERAIQNNPYDLNTRKVFADWLDEFGSEKDADLAVEQREWTKEKQDSIVWLTKFAGTLGHTCINYDDVVHGDDEIWEPITYDMMMQAAKDFLETGYSFTQLGSEQARDVLWNDAVREEFWNHFTVVTKRNVEEKDREVFIGCSC